jgi:putative Ca2+/H+ antiporter (TMEM165/GDT1 family)
MKLVRQVLVGVLVSVLSAAIIGTAIGVWKLSQLPGQVSALEDDISQLYVALNEHMQEEHEDVEQDP